MRFSRVYFSEARGEGGGAGRVLGGGWWERRGEGHN